METKTRFVALSKDSYKIHALVDYIDNVSSREKLHEDYPYWIASMMLRVHIKGEYTVLTGVHYFGWGTALNHFVIKDKKPELIDEVIYIDKLADDHYACRYYPDQELPGRPLYERKIFMHETVGDPRDKFDGYPAELIEFTRQYLWTGEII